MPQHARPRGLTTFSFHSFELVLTKPCKQIQVMMMTDSQTDTHFSFFFLLSFRNTVAAVAAVDLISPQVMQKKRALKQD